MHTFIERPSELEDGRPERPSRNGYPSHHRSSAATGVMVVALTVLAGIALAAPAFFTTGRADAQITRDINRPRVAGRLELTRRGRFILIGLPVMLAATAILVLAGIFTAPVIASPRFST